MKLSITTNILTLLSMFDCPDVAAKLLMNCRFVHTRSYADRSFVPIQDLSRHCDAPKSVEMETRSSITTISLLATDSLSMSMERNTTLVVMSLLASNSLPTPMEMNAAIIPNHLMVLIIANVIGNTARDVIAQCICNHKGLCPSTTKSLRGSMLSKLLIEINMDPNGVPTKRSSDGYSAKNDKLLDIRI